MTTPAAAPETPHDPAASQRADDVDHRSPWPRAIIAALAAAAIVTVVLLAFLWPTKTSSTKDLPVQVVASQEAYDQFTQRASDAAAAHGTDLPFTFSRADTRADAVQAIERRESYGAYVLLAAPGDGLEVLTAPAASPAVKTMLVQSADAMLTAQTRGAIAQAQSAPPAQPASPEAAAAAQQQMLGQVDQALAGPTVTDVVPLSDDDAQGSGLAVAALPLTIGGILGGMLLSNLVRGTWRRVVGVVVYAVVGGIVMVLILDTWFGFAPAPAFELWAAIALSLAATVGLIVGLHGALGAPGLGIGALITMFIGNPIASAQAPREFLPGPFGEIGQLFVPGATATLVRDLSYFPAADMTQPWLVLAGWVALGVILMVVGHHRTGGHAPSHAGRGRRAARPTAEAAAG